MPTLINKMTSNINIRKIIGIVVLISGISLMVVGILQGEPAAVVRNAVIICLDCIGIG